MVERISRIDWRMYHESTDAVTRSQVVKCVVSEESDVNGSEKLQESVCVAAPDNGGDCSGMESDNDPTPAAATSSTADVII